MFYRCLPVYLLSQRFLHVLRRILNLRKYWKVEVAPVEETAAQVAETAVPVAEIVAVEAAAQDLHAVRNVAVVAILVVQALVTLVVIQSVQLLVVSLVEENVILLAQRVV